MDWRETGDPYRIWVSEIMLQQTTVQAVTPYYRRFLTTFPDIETLARAPREKVLKAWEGLGYYARARNLHRTAAILVAEHGGALPCEPEALMGLPGIGRSTAGAIAAIAFRRDVPILDSNVKRVIARLRGVREDLRRPAVERGLWRESSRLVLPGKGRETALALMDLGATVCRPARPMCAACPLSYRCAAFGSGSQDEIPLKIPGRRIPRHDVLAAVIEDRKGRILIVRRPEDGPLGGLWDFPGGRKARGETLREALRRTVLEDAGIDVAVAGPLGTVEQAFTLHRITLHAFRCRKIRGRLPGDGAWRWMAPGDLPSHAFPAAQRKLIGRHLAP
jgi:A/G-specific adenine glycosylase